MMEREQVADIDLKHYVQVVWHWLWLIILISVIAAGVAYIASRLSTPVYEASATLMIREGQHGTGLDYNSILMSERLARTYSMMLKERPVLEETIHRIGLDESAETLGKMITVENVRDTMLINVKVRNADPALAALTTNTLVEVFAEEHGRIMTASYGSAMESLDREIQRLQSQIENSQQTLDAERAKREPDSAEIARLETLLAQYRSVYADLLSSYEGMRVAAASAAETLILVKPATAPSKPVLPRKALNTVLAGAAGALLALGIALVLEYLSDTIKNADDVQRIARVPTLATVSRFGRSELSKGLPLMSAHPESAAAEAYRLLRTNLQFATADIEKRAVTVVVSSAAPQEGKTTTVANLGVSLAQIGKRVLLVDADLRCPALHTQFGLSNDAGLTTLFLQQLRPEDIIKETGVPGLHVLTSGPIPANPAELLEYPRFATVLASLQGLADYVILDSPPVLSVADTAILARKADGILLLVVPEKTRSEFLKDSMQLLKSIDVRVLGVVLNKANRRLGYYYYGQSHRRSTHGKS